MSEVSPDEIDELLGRQDAESSSRALLDTDADADADASTEAEPARSGDYTTPDNLIVVPAPAEASARLESAKPSEIAVHDPGSSRSWWIPGGMLAVAAAAIAAWWIWPPSDEIRGPGEVGPAIASRDALPSYVLETDGGLEQLGDTDTGGPAVTHHRYRRETKFEWILRPKAAATGEVAVRGFAFVDGGSAGLPLALDALTTVADSGAIRIVGEISQLGLEPGRYTIALVVARPDALPQQAPDLEGPDASKERELRRVELVIED